MVEDVLISLYSGVDILSHGSYCVVLFCLCHLDVKLFLVLDIGTLFCSENVSVLDCLSGLLGRERSLEGLELTLHFGYIQTQI